ncbi:MAG TPA: molybdopterin-synthase adenylyltransferase MoeB [Gammaproteobacteria bacterium]|nr:molybdopterin-synthase adenylyltransferase MoeB [Gammaproteobacteria bacterium]|tara:strand:- start:4021 stop:4773 length:753 start_codon:yes stop_codon:yes gene_type:complete
MNDEELLRYSRQIMLPEIEVEGQERMLNSQVLIVGLGGLGCPVAMYLAAAGVGHLVLADFDQVDLSNLQRQIAHTTARVGINKVDSANATIEALNPEVQVTCISTKLSSEVLRGEVEQADVVVDCTDNFTIRFEINEHCVATETPLVSGAAIRLEGQLLVYDPRIESAPCYRCLYDTAEEGALNCAENGVAAPVVGVIGTLQATEAIKLIVGFGESLAGYLLVFDAKYMDWKKLRLKKNPKCPTCGTGSP